MPEKILPLSAFYDPSKVMSMAMQAGRLENQEHSQALQEERMLQQQAKAGMEQRLAGIKEALPSMPNGPEKAQALTWALNAGAGPQDPRITVTTEALQADGNLLQTMLMAEDDEARTYAFGEYLKRNPKDLKVVQDSHNKQRALVGYGQFLEAAGLPNNDSTRAAVADSGAMQNQLGQAAMESPLEMARREEIQAKTKANQLQIAGMNVGAKVLVEGMAPVAPILEMGEKYLPKMEALTKAGESGLAYQGGRIARAGDTQFGAYLDGMKERRTQAFDDIGKIYEATGNLQRMKDLHTSAGDPLPRGETLETINAKLQSYTLLKDLRDAEVQYYGNPNATTLKAVKEMRDAANGQIQNWNGTKKSLDEERIGMTKAAQALAQGKYTDKKTYDKNLAAATTEYFDKLPPGASLEASRKLAASLARPLGLNPADILKGSADPNKPQTSIVMKQENAESQTVGKGFGEQYLKMQEAGSDAAGKLGRLDRMGALLEGVTTGKLTPAMTELQAIGESFGMKVEPGLSAKQALESLSNEMALQLRNPSGGAGMPGALSDQDRNFLKSMTPGLSKTNDGNKLIIETARLMAKRDQTVASMARKYRKANGHLDEGFYDELSAYSDQHPLFKGMKTPAGAESPGAAPEPLTFPDTDKEQRYQEWKARQQ